MTRKRWIAVLFTLFASTSAFSQSTGSQQSTTTSKQAEPQNPPPADKEQLPPSEDNPPEEDEMQKPEQYAFNPLKAKQVLAIGNFYWKKGKYKGAAERFQEATRWNPGWAEAYLRLGEAEAKLRNKDDARKALSRAVQIAPDSKEGREARKLMESL